MTSQRYAAGWNVPGCLPDEPGLFESFSDAVDYLAETVKRFRDEDHEASSMPITSVKSAEIDEVWRPVLEALKHAGSGPVLEVYTSDRRYVFWIMPVGGGTAP